MLTCVACGMPLEDQSNLGAETSKGPACVHCITPEGELKSCAEIFEGGVQFFMPFINDRALAERVTIKNMKQQPAWQGCECDCLKGAEATDEEFAAAMTKLM